MEDTKQTWEERFAQSKFAKSGGACFECCDYEAMYDDLKSFIAEELKRREEECAKEINENTSDGYHTFKELYEHRFVLWIALCKALGLANHSQDRYVWRSKKHSDGTSYDGWFILGMNAYMGEQITYHLPIEMWEETNGFNDLEKALPFDGHTSMDVIKRIKTL